MSDLVPAADALHARLATEHGAHILAASAPVFGDRGPVNRARLFAPDGGAGHQDKQIMTPYERTVLGIVPGDPLTVFETVFGRIGVLICYNSEFRLLARALVEAGADLLLVPACTEGLSGQPDRRPESRSDGYLWTAGPAWRRNRRNRRRRNGCARLDRGGNRLGPDPCDAE